MRLVRGELLKLRRRWATYIVLGILLGLMAFVYLLIGAMGRGPGGAAAGLVTRFPGAYGVINQFVFGFGSVLAVAYAAAVVGSDWSFGVIRVIVARGESRARYVLAKAAGLAIVLTLGVVVALAAGIALTFLAAGMLGSGTGQLLGEAGAPTLAESLVFGLLVLLQRAAIGFAVAMVLRSQLAGIVAGIVLYVAEPILSLILFALSFPSAMRGGGADIGVQWYQFLPFSIGDSVLSAAAAAPGGGSLRFTAVPLDIALPAVVLYLAVALAVAMVSLVRAEVTA